MPPVPVCPSPRRPGSFATVQEQTANTMPATEEALAGPGAGSAVAVECGPCPTGRGPDLAIAEHGRRDAEDWRAVLECLKNPGP